MDKLKELSQLCFDRDIYFYLNYSCAENNWWADTGSIYVHKERTYRNFKCLDFLIETMIEEIKEID